jgi:hypothetical protein
MTDAELIKHYGGPTKLAKRLGFDEKGGVQRVQNWLSRGIPSYIKVRYPNLFLSFPARTKPTQPETRA